jgi:hypothetical protein
MATLPALELMMRLRDELNAAMFAAIAGPATGDGYRMKLAEIDLQVQRLVEQSGQ